MATFAIPSVFILLNFFYRFSVPYSKANHTPVFAVYYKPERTMHGTKKGKKDPAFCWAEVDLAHSAC